MPVADAPGPTYKVGDIVEIHPDDHDLWPELIGQLGIVKSKTVSSSNYPLIEIDWGIKTKLNDYWAEHHVRLSENGKIDRLLEKYK